MTCLQAQSLNRAGIDAGAAINAAIGIHDGLAVRHADRTSGTLIDARLTPCAFRIIYFSRHSLSLSKTKTNSLSEKVRNHNAFSSRVNLKNWLSSDCFFNAATDVP